MYTWGCNDQKALGRNASGLQDTILIEPRFIFSFLFYFYFLRRGGETDEASAVPGLAEGLAEVEVVALSAGDSHTAALTSDGRVFACGCFRVGRVKGITAINDI